MNEVTSLYNIPRSPDAIILAAGHTQRLNEKYYQGNLPKEYQRVVTTPRGEVVYSQIPLTEMQRIIKEGVPQALELFQILELEVNQLEDPTWFKDELAEQVKVAENKDQPQHQEALEEVKEMYGAYAHAVDLMKHYPKQIELLSHTFMEHLQQQLAQGLSEEERSQVRELRPQIQAIIEGLNGRLSEFTEILSDGSFDQVLANAQKVLNLPE